MNINYAEGDYDYGDLTPVTRAQRDGKTPAAAVYNSIWRRLLLRCDQFTPMSSGINCAQFTSRTKLVDADVAR